MSNCINSGVDTVGVLTQYQPLRLNTHIGIGMPWDLDRNVLSLIPILYCDSTEEQLEYIKNLELVEDYKTDGSEPMYSDFSFMTLGFIVEAVTGQDICLLYTSRCV